MKQIPVEYCANKKAWMTGEIFREWLKKLDRIMILKKRKIVMIVDNCTAHPIVELEHIKLIFLPPNTSITQPMEGYQESETTLSKDSFNKTFDRS